LRVDPPFNGRPQLFIAMANRNSLLTRFYDKIVLERPRLILLCLVVVIAFLGYKAKDFKLDASTETLILETDEDFIYSQIIKSRYGGYDYLLMIYTPTKDLFSDEALAHLTRLRDDLRQLNGVSSVISILDAPLLKSSSEPIGERVSAVGIQTLESPTVDRRLAKIEFSKSPLYQNLLVSPDLKTTALQIKLRTDDLFQDMSTRRDLLRIKQANEPLTASELDELKKITEQLEKLREKNKKIRHQNIAKIRAIMDNYRRDAELFLGGVSMIADDMISFIKSDLKVFGIGVLFFLIVTLSIIFRSSRWVLLPMLCCSFSAISMMGLLGMFGWQVTVISSNFISLQLIITMAITIHLIVRYRDLAFHNPGAEQRKLILETVRLMVTPCLYAALTTIAGFGSLLLCDLLPVKTFGWMMIAGIIVSLGVTFLLFPAGLMVVHRKPPWARRDKRRSRYSLTSLLAGFTGTHGKTILVSSGIIFVISLLGISRLVVENSFINYFKDTTEIYQGLKVIDQKLGGTTPLDVIIEVDESEASSQVPTPGIDAKSDDNFEEFEEFEEFDEFDESESAEDDERYWFTADKMARITKIHDYLDSLPETGKVLSLATMLKITEDFNNGRPLDNFQLALLYGELPDKFKTMVLKPYVSVEHNQVRYAIRVRDSDESLRRNELLKKIKYDLINKLGLKEDHVHLTGLLVLYNNMLQSLFESQILTLGVVVVALMGMFLILFRSFKISLIAMTPNLLAIGAVLGVIGWLNIPLDMMTITIAAISMGIAVDNTIHYIYRFRQEFNVEQNYVKTVFKCHGSIGYAMYYTSVTIIIGFSILALSNFLPSIYFGLLTGLAMLIALIASLTLLPQLLVVFKPFGPEIEGHQN
jgi:predicted RND superfamily exporter protein